MDGRRIVAVLAAVVAVVAASVGVASVVRHDAPAAAELVQPDQHVTGLASFLEAPEPEPQPDPVPDRGSPPDPVPDPDRRAAFVERFPTQDAAEPGTGAGEDDWAVLVGINEHLGGVPDNVASAQDAERLRALLLREGWSDDRIVLLTDTEATGEMIREALAWLERKAGGDSRVVFHFSGHSKKWYGAGGTITDQALWPTDDDFVRREELAEALGAVDHDAFWGNVAACEAAGFSLPGVTAPGRVWTFSSAADEKSYEDPQADHSVWGRFLLDQGMWQHDDAPPVQHAFADAAPNAAEYTSLQVPYGPQRPVLVDDLGEPFDLTAVPARITPPMGQ
ncbi:MAG: caspase family protein [Nitriliruptor sp.]